jgi:hypothetical protein
MIGPRSAQWSARSSLSAGRFKRLLGLDSRPTTVAVLLPRYAAETPFPEAWGQVPLFGLKAPAVARHTIGQDSGG